MPTKAVADAVEARLSSQWTATPFIAYDTQADTPDDNAFLVVQYPVSNGSRPVLERFYWDEGAFRFVLNVRRGIGLAQGLTWADTLAGLFRDVKFDGVETFVPSAPIVDDNTEDGEWISLAVIVPYRYQFAA